MDTDRDPLVLGDVELVLGVAVVAHGEDDTGRQPSSWRQTH